MNNYKNKYLKYKEKYLQLKNKLNNITDNKDEIEQEGAKLLKEKINDLLSSQNKCIVKNDNKYYIENTCIKNDNTSINIPFTWSNYKKLSDNDKKQINLSRKNIIDSLIKFILFKYSPCNDLNNEIICNFVPSGSTGADGTLNSDYDLTLNGNYKISEIIQMFNSIFEKEFGETSAVIFDTNLYGYSFIIPLNAVINNKKIWTPITPTQTQSELLTITNISIQQDKWSYLRIKSFLNNQITNILSLDNNDYNEYFTQHDLNNMSIKKKQINYIQYMSQFEKLMYYNNDRNLYNNNDNIKNTIIETLSNMNYYGDETYFTQGAFMHVVGLMYFKNKTDEDKKQLFKKKYYLIHSMIENMAYFIHAYYEHHYNIIYAIKYYNRFINAYLWLCIINNNSNIENIVKIDNLTANIKSYIRNRPDDFILNNKIKFNIDNNNVNDIKTIIISQLNDLIYELCNNSLEINNINFYLLSLLYILNKTINQNQNYTSIKITNNNNKYTIS